MATMLNGFGYDAAVLLYRVSTGEATRAMALDDAKRAYSLVRRPTTRTARTRAFFPPTVGSTE